MRKYNRYYIIIFLVLGLAFTFRLASAGWSAPSAIPPLLNNLYYLVTGSVNQAKSSGMIINNDNNAIGLVVAAGNTIIGTTSSSSILDVDGEIKIGDTNLVCNSDSVGSWRYNDSLKVTQLCNGINWKELSWTCEAGNHLSGTTCVSNTIPCAITNGVGQQIWNATSSTWGACVLVSCDSGFHEVSGTCVSNVECSSATNNVGRWLVHPNGDIAATWSGIGMSCGVGYADYVAYCKPCYFASKTCGGYTYSRGTMDYVNNGGGGWSWYYICREPAQ